MNEAEEAEWNDDTDNLESFGGKQTKTETRAKANTIGTITMVDSSPWLRNSMVVWYQRIVESFSGN